MLQVVSPGGPKGNKQEGRNGKETDERRESKSEFYRKWQSRACASASVSCHWLGTGWALGTNLVDFYMQVSLQENADGQDAAPLINKS